MDGRYEWGESNLDIIHVVGNFADEVINEELTTGLHRCDHGSGLFERRRHLLLADIGYRDVWFGVCLGVGK